MLPTGDCGEGTSIGESPTYADAARVDQSECRGSGGHDESIFERFWIVQAADVERYTRHVPSILGVERGLLRRAEAEELRILLDT